MTSTPAAPPGSARASSTTTYLLAPGPAADRAVPDPSDGRWVVRGLSLSQAGGSCLGEPAVAFRSYGAGCLAVGVAGPVDRAMARRVGGLLRDLRPHSRHELLITFALLESWDPQLARVIGQARIHHLIDGGHVELRDAPPGLVAAWSPLPPDTTPDRDGPAAGGRDRGPCLEQWGLLS